MSSGNDMQTNSLRDILNMLNGNALPPQIEDMTVGKLIEHLQAKGLFVFVGVIGKGMGPIKYGQDKELIEGRFMTKYGLSKDDIKTLKLYVTGLTYPQMSERLGITTDGIGKRLQKIRRSLGASNRTHVIAKAKEEEII